MSLVPRGPEVGNVYLAWPESIYLLVPYTISLRLPCKRSLSGIPDSFGTKCSPGCSSILYLRRLILLLIVCSLFSGKDRLDPWTWSQHNGIGTLRAQTQYPSPLGLLAEIYPSLQRCPSSNWCKRIQLGIYGNMSGRRLTFGTPGLEFRFVFHCASRATWSLLQSVLLKRLDETRFWSQMIYLHHSAINLWSYRTG